MQVINFDQNLNEINNIQQLNLTYPELAKIKTPEWYKRINRAKKIEVSHNCVLFSGSGSRNNLMLILKGTIRIYQTSVDGRELTLYRVAAGDLCILTLNCLLRNQAFGAIAEAETDVTALILSADDFNYFMNISREFQNYVLASLAEHLSRAIALVSDTSLNHLDIRLASMLSNLFECSQTRTLDLTHQELACELGSTREVISRILKQFEKHDYIKLFRGRIELLSAEGLKCFSTEKNKLSCH